MSILLNNKILKAAEAKIESGLTPENRANYQKIVVAGMKLALDKGPNGILASLHGSKNPLEDAAKGAVNLCLLMRKQSRGTMPIKAMVPAGMTLMLQALDFLDKSGAKKIGAGDLSKASRYYTNFLFQQLHITPQMLQQAAGQVHGIMQDPQKMDVINRKAGFMKHPAPAAPTSTPQAPEGTNGV